MEGVTHPIMRALLAEKGGVGVVCTEFVRITKNPLGRKTLEKHVVAPPRGVLSVQVMGNDLANMAEATTMVTEAGADIVDINLGCPAPNAVRKGVGSAMLKDRALLGRVLGAMRERTHLPLSAKIRAGFHDSSHVLDVARTVEDSGADFITVHPRRRKDFYEGVADWRIIRTLRESLSIPVVGNGDVWYAGDALRMQQETGCHAVMIGRPAMRNPWMFVQIAALRSGVPAPKPSGDDVLGHLLDLRRRLEGSFSERAIIGELKEAIRYLARALDDDRKFMRDALRTPNADALLRVAEQRLAGMPAEALDLGAAGGRLEQSGRAVSGNAAA